MVRLYSIITAIAIYPAIINGNIQFASFQAVAVPLAMLLRGNIRRQSPDNFFDRDSPKRLP